MPVLKVLGGSYSIQTGAVSELQSALAEGWKERVHSTAREAEGSTEEVTAALGLEGCTELTGALKVETAEEI